MSISCDAALPSGPVAQAEFSSQHEIVNLRTTLLAGAFLLIGLALLYVSGLDLQVSAAVNTLLQQVGGLLIPTALLTIGWDLVGRRAFAQEILTRARISADVANSGLVKVGDQYLNDVQWSDLFANARHVDVVVAYGNTWRSAHYSRLKALSRRTGTRLRVFLPDADEASTASRYADRFNMSPEVLSGKVREAAQEFAALKDRDGGEVEVYRRAGDTTFSCYRFDRLIVVTLYSHQKERVDVPTFVFQEGPLYKFFRAEIDAIAAQSERIDA